MIALFVLYNNYLLVVVIQTNGKISLATRSLLELERYICEIYQDDVEKCNICKKLCLKVGHLKSIVLDMASSLAKCLICSLSTLPWLILFEYHCLLIVDKSKTMNKSCFVEKVMLFARYLRYWTRWCYLSKTLL